MSEGLRVLLPVLPPGVLGLDRWRSTINSSGLLRSCYGE